MFTAYAAVKGGSGTTVCAAAHALVAGRAGPALLVDLDGDLPRVLGLPETGPGIAEWLAAGPDVPADALERLLVPVRDHLRLLPRGRGPLPGDPGRGALLARLLGAAPRQVVVDLGTRPRGLAALVGREADRCVLVTRPCYLALSRLGEVDLAPTEVLVVREAGRALRTADVAAATGVPVRTSIRVDPAVARAVDAGLLASRLPRTLGRRLASAA